MANGSLSQEEIEILLKGALPQEPESASPNLTLSDVETDAIGEIGNISMGNAATSLSLLLGKKVEIATPSVELTTSDQVSTANEGKCVIVTVKYSAGIDGYNFFLLSQRDGAIIADLMMGGDGTNPPTELSEMHTSAIAEAMNQMMGSAATSISSMLNSKVDITPPELVVTDVTTDQAVQSMLHQADPLVRVSFRLNVETLIDSTFVQVIPLNVVKQMVDKMLQAMSVTAGQDDPQPQVPTQPINSANSVNQTPMKSGPTTDKQVLAEPAAVVRPAQFGSLQPVNVGTPPENLELLLDVPLQVSVELGRAKKTIREVMNMAPGAVVELDRLAGEPVDMLVNGKLIARCEVVVINETFGIRITDIVHPNERLKSVNC